MTPATEARIIALATALGMESPRITVRPTTGAGSRSWRKGFEATARGTRFAPTESATGDTKEGTIAALGAKLVARLRDDIACRRADASRHTAAADRLEAALTAALATGEHAPTEAL